MKRAFPGPSTALARVRAGCVKHRGIQPKLAPQPHSHPQQKARLTTPPTTLLAGAAGPARPPRGSPPSPGHRRARAPGRALWGWGGLAYR